MEESSGQPLNAGEEETPDWWHKPNQVQEWNAITQQVRQGIVQQDTYRARGRSRGRGRGRNRGNTHNDYKAQHETRERGQASSSVDAKKFDKPPEIDESIINEGYYRPSFVEDPWFHLLSEEERGRPH